MTIVYGVTFVGGRLQIEKQLKELNVPEEILFKGSSYLVNQVFRSIGELFTSARKIQVRHLTSCNCFWIAFLGLGGQTRATDEILMSNLECLAQ